MEVQKVERKSSRWVPQAFTMSVIAIILVFAALMVSSSSEAATGDQLASFDATVTAGIPPCGAGTGIAFDGVRLYLSCGGSNVLERVVASGAHGSAGPITVAGMTSIDALAYDATAGGGKIWACQNHNDVYLITLSPLPPALPTVATGTFQFTTTNGCRDGLAFDGVGTPTLWASGDARDSIQHYALPAGASLGHFSGLTAKLNGYGNSGIAVGGSMLYLGNNGGSEIYECDKGLVTCTLISTFPARIEDLECDDVTFAPKGAIWSQDAHDRILNAWEIPAGTCGVGGVSPTPSSTTQPVGGLVSLSVSDTSPSSPVLWIAAVLSGGLAMLAAGAWYGRKRRLR